MRTNELTAAEYNACVTQLIEEQTPRFVLRNGTQPFNETYWEEMQKAEFVCGVHDVFYRGKCSQCAQELEAVFARRNNMTQPNILTYVFDGQEIKCHEGTVITREDNDVFVIQRENETYRYPLSTFIEKASLFNGVTVYAKAETVVFAYD